MRKLYLPFGIFSVKLQYRRKVKGQRWDYCNMDKEIGFLIIHGFAGNIGDIEPLNRYLLNKGFYTICIKLKGHTGKRADLARVSYGDWIDSAEEGLMKLSKKCKKIIIIGFSMGGLIAANICMKYAVDAIITLSTPIYYWDIKRISINILEDFRTRDFSNLKRYLKSSTRIPILALTNFKILLMKTKPIFKQIRCPILVIQGLLDDTVYYRSAHYIYSNVQSQLKIIKLYDNSNHIICHSEDNNEVFNDILVFVKKVVIQ